MPWARLACCATLAGVVATACGGGPPQGAHPGRAPDQHIRAAYRVVLDAAGDLLVPDGTARRVWRLDPHTGRLSTLAGDGGSALRGVGGPATSASLGLPRDAAVAPDGTVYIVVSSDQVVRVSADGLLAVAAGTGQKGGTGDGGPAAMAQLDGPTAVAVDRLGNVFIAEAAGRIRRIDARTSTIGTAATGINQAHGLAAADDGSIYIAETGANRVRRLGADGALTTIETGDLATPTGVTVTSTDDLLVVDFGHSRVVRVSRAGSISTLIDSVTGPTGVAVAADGTTYVSQLDHGLLRIDRSGRRTSIG